MTGKQRITGGEIIQTRALKTREKLLKEAILIFAENGYHNTTMDEIAKHADVSVGTSYRYFKDKKELLLAALTYGFEHISDYVNLSEKDIADVNIKQILIRFEKLHQDYFDIHEEIEGLRHTDVDVKRLYDNFLGIALKGIFQMLPKEIRDRNNSFDDLRIAFGIIENYCHNCTQNNPDKKTITYIRKKTVTIVESLLFENN